MNFAVVILGLLALSLEISAQTTNVQACIWQSNANTLPINAYIYGCYNSPCSAPQLEYIEMDLVFQAPRQIRSMRTEAHAYLTPLPVGVNYTLGDAFTTCNFLTNTYCPLIEGEVVSYNLQMFIESWMPVGTSVNLEFVIKDVADNSAVACLRVGMTITPPNDAKQSKESKNKVNNNPVTNNKE